MGDAQRGLEVVEHACGISHIFAGETIANISKGIDTYSIRTPLGVCAGIAPFNFPAMIPMWMFPFAITCGNTFVLKPSEKVAGSTNHLLKLLQEINLPKGVVNVVQGNDEPLQDVGTFLGFSEIVLGPTYHHLMAVLDVVRHHLLQVQQLWAPLDECNVVD